ncbi:MAG: transglycosylase SLT domain-containing protein [Methylophilaceae bacterium]
MQRKDARLIMATTWYQNTMLLFSFFLFSICLCFASASIAETNARGVKFEFLIEEHSTAEAKEVNADNGALDTLALTPSPELKAAERDLWTRIQAGYAMPDISSPYTAKYEYLYASRPDYVQQMMVRSEKYLFYVVEEVEKRGMPMEVALLPMIESAYNPKAYSRSRAVGIWQFMPATGRYYGLQQNWWVDRRRDVTAATEAALNYLEKLHGMFGSWDLALAAYNAGEGTVGRAINKNLKAGLATDYQSLSLPLETTHYVPKLQAIKNIVNNPEQYGLSIASIPNEAYFAVVNAPAQIDAKLAAKLAEISDKEFALLNPSFKRPIVASRNNSHKLLLPVSTVSRFQNNLNNHDKSFISWKVYKGKRGERVASIARKFNINTSHLRKVNGLPNNKKLNNTVHLLVPSGKSKATRINVAKLANQKIQSNSSKRKRLKRVTHKIKRGETLSALARRYGTNTRALMKMNRLKSTKLKIGQVIRVKGKRIRAKTKRI